MPLTITSEPDAPEADRSLLSDAIDQYNMTVTGDTAWSPIRLFVRDEAGVVRGGLLGDVWGGCAHINTLYLDEELRQQGYGSKLLQLAESEARSKGARFVALTTFSFQAPAFYQQHGYEVFSKLDDYPPGHTYYFLRKNL